jgi:hypothetical protein
MMVQKYTLTGAPYCEPPYTPEEEAELQQRANQPPIAIYRPTRLWAWKPWEAEEVAAQASQQPPQEE